MAQGWQPAGRDRSAMAAIADTLGVAASSPQLGERRGVLAEDLGREECRLWRLYRAGHRHEFVKALVFEIDDAGMGTVRVSGASAKAWPYAVRTVTDINAVVDNCSVALQEAEEMAGFRPTQCVIALPGTGQRLHDDPVAGAEARRHGHHGCRTAEADQRRPARALREASEPSPGRRVCPGRCTAGSRCGHWRPNRRLSGHKPVGSRPPRQDQRFNAFAPGPSGCPPERGRAAGAGASRDVAEPYAVAAFWQRAGTASGALFIDIAAGPRRGLVRHGGIEGTRMFALAAAFTKSIADRLDLPSTAEEMKIDYARGVLVEQRDEVARSSPTTWQSGPPASSWCWTSWRGDLLPGRYISAAAFRIPEIDAPPGEASGSACVQPPSGVCVITPAQVERIKDGTHLWSTTGRDAARLAYQAIELQSNEDPLDLALRRVLRAMKM